MLKGCEWALTGYKGNRRRKVKSQKPWVGPQEMEPIQDPLLMSCVSLPKCLYLSGPQLLSGCVTLGRLGLNISEVSSSSEILFVISFLVLWIFALSPPPGHLCITDTIDNSLLLKSFSLAFIVRATQGLIPGTSVLSRDPQGSVPELPLFLSFLRLNSWALLVSSTSTSTSVTYKYLSLVLMMSHRTRKMNYGNGFGDLTILRDVL